MVAVDADRCKPRMLYDLQSLFNIQVLHFKDGHCVLYRSYMRSIRNVGQYVDVGC